MMLRQEIPPHTCYFATILEYSDTCGGCARLRRKKKAESPSSRTIPQNIINKTEPALFWNQQCRFWNLQKWADVSSSKFLFLGGPPNFVASRANYYNKQKICQRITQKQKPLTALSNDLQQK
jgi:hypothetical protein